MRTNLKLWIYSMIIFCFVTQTSQAINKEWKNGYVITSAKDTLKGQIAITDENGITAKTCIFRTSESYKETVYTPNDLSDFVIDGNLFFTSLDVNSTYIKGKYFVQRLVHGMTNLYYINFPEDSIAHYIISKPNIESMATIANIRTLGSNDIRMKRLRRSLEIIFSDCPSLKEDIHKRRLNKEGLIEITKKYNDLMCSEERCVIYYGKKPKRYSYLTPFAEMKLTPIKYIKKQLVCSPVVGVDYSLSLLPYSDRFRFHFALALAESNYSGHDIDETTRIDYTLKFVSIDNHLLLEYRFMEKKVKPFFGLGFSQYINMPIKNEVWFNDGSANNEINYDKYFFFLNINGGIDITVNKQHSIPVKLSYQRILLAPNNSKHFVDTRTANIISLSVGYTFRL